MDDSQQQRTIDTGVFASKNLGDTKEQRIEQSIQQLEYHLLDGIHQLTLNEKKRIAVLSSHGTSEDRTLVSLLQSLLPYYNIASFDLKAFPEEPQKTLENLNRFDLLFVSNPKEVFSTAESLWWINSPKLGEIACF